MEALLEKEGAMENWNDDRLDELSGRVDDGFKEMREGFARVDQEMKEGFTKIDKRFERIDKRFERIDERFARIDERFAGLASREDFQHLEARLFKGLLTLLGVFGGVISALIAINAS